MPDDAVVKGKRIYTNNGEVPHSSTNTDNFPGGYPYPGSAYHNALMDPVTGAYDSATTRVDTEEGVELTPLQQKAVDKLVDTIRNFRTLLETHNPENLRAVDKDGNTVFDGKEMMQLVKATDFIITNRSFERDGATAVHTMTNKYTGQPDVYIQVNADKLVDWMGSVDANGDIYYSEANAMNFLAHEIGHATGAGRALNESLGQNGLTTSEHIFNESFAASSGRAVLDMLGKNFPDWQPQPGYGDLITVQTIMP